MITKNPETIRRELEALHTWELTEETSLEQLQAKFQTEKNQIKKQDETYDGIDEETFEKLNSKLQVINSKVTAVCTGPKQDFSLQKKSWKQRREEKKKKAKMSNGEFGGDYISCAIQTQILQVRARKQTTQTNISTSARYALSFGVPGKADGMSASEEEKNEMIRVFNTSDNMQERSSYLKAMTDEILNFRLDMDMFQEDYIVKHFDYLFDLSNKMTAFNDIKDKDQENAEFFEHLPAFIKNLLQAVWGGNIVEDFSTALMHIAMEKGIEVNSADFIKDFYQSEFSKQNKELFLNKLRVDIENSRKAVKKAYEEQLQLEIEHYKDVHKTETVIETDLTQKLTNIQKLFEDKPEQYTQHQDDLKDLYQKVYKDSKLYNDCEKEIAACKHIIEKYKNVEEGSVYASFVVFAKQKLYETQNIGLVLKCRINQSAELIDKFMNNSEIVSLDVKQQPKMNQNNPYQFGMPNREGIIEIIANSTRMKKEDIKILKHKKASGLCAASDTYFELLNKIHERNGDYPGFTQLQKTHQKFIQECESFSGILAKGSEDQQIFAPIFGQIAMKTMTYTAMVAGFSSDYSYITKVEKAKETDGFKLGDLIKNDGLGILYEGTHGYEIAGNQELKLDIDGYEIKRLDTILREDAKQFSYVNDQDFVSIVMLCDSYENFIRNTFIPPACNQTASEDEKIAYKERMKLISNRLITYNDRIMSLTKYYLNQNSKTKEKQGLCEVLENNILTRDTKNNIFIRVAQLTERLKNNNFDSEEFNRLYTGVPLISALRKTSVKKVEFDLNDYEIKGNSSTTVYIPNSDGQWVYREGSNIREYKTKVKKGFREMEVGYDLDVEKTGVLSFETTKGKMTDYHKSSRDTAVYLVSDLLGADIAASADSVMFQYTYEGKTYSTIGTEMSYEKGTSAAQIVIKENQRNKKSKQRNSESEKSTEKQLNESNLNKFLDFSLPENLEKIYLLQVLDAICGSVDRHANNYILQTDAKGKILSLKAIDNDMSFGESMIPLVTADDFEKFCSSKKLLNGSMYCTPVYENAFPCISKTIYNKVMNIKPKDLANALRGHITDRELEMAITRLHALQEYFEKLNNGEIKKVYDLKDGNEKKEFISDTIKKAEEIKNANIEKKYTNYFTILKLNHY